jgi:4-hydroxy-tetrahydrodipicolinate reductase
MIKVGVLGAGGRMGQAIIAALAAEPDSWLVGGVERPGHPMCGSPIGDGLVVCANAAPVAHKADVLIDFTGPEALEENIRAALDGDAALLVGTTGLGVHHQEALDAAARSIPILQAANTSLGVTLLEALVEQASRSLGPHYDIEILEWHHRHKVDAPSGTALLLGEAAARGRGRILAELRLSPHAESRGARAPGGIGFASLRAGSVAGDHAVILSGDGETITLAHRAESRNLFAEGAVRAARWLVGRRPGRYRMADVLGLQASPG